MPRSLLSGASSGLEVSMPTTVKYPRYSVVDKKDPEFNQIFDRLVDPPPKAVVVGLTLIQEDVPAARPLTTRQFLITRYCLDKIMAAHGQGCLSVGPQADADVFFAPDYTITGLQQVHAMAHLLLAKLDHGLIGPIPTHVVDRVLVDNAQKPTRFTVVFTLPLKPDEGLHDWVVGLWTSFQALLNGSIEGEVALLLPIAP
jgi:hypothetical protein